MNRPMVPPAPAKPAQTPTARARPSGGKTLVMVDRVPGMMNAAPSPATTRAAISTLAEPAVAAHTMAIP